MTMTKNEYIDKTREELIMLDSEIDALVDKIETMPTDKQQKYSNKIETKTRRDSKCR